MLDQLEDKFIVINKKRFDELDNAVAEWSIVKGAGDRLMKAIQKFVDRYKWYVAGKSMDQKYIVCNQDEPYAEEVARIILEGEKNKGENI